MVLVWVFRRQRRRVRLQMMVDRSNLNRAAQHHGPHPPSSFYSETTQAQKAKAGSDKHSKRRITNPLLYFTFIFIHASRLSALFPAASSYSRIQFSLYASSSSSPLPQCRIKLQRLFGLTSRRCSFSSHRKKGKEPSLRQRGLTQSNKYGRKEKGDRNENEQRVESKVKSTAP